MNEQLVGILLFESNVYPVFGHITLGLFQILGSTIPQHLQPKTGLACNGPHGNCYRKSYHASCAGNPDSHGILQDVGTQVQVNIFGQTTQLLRSLGHAERNRHRLGTTNSRHHFTMKQGQHLLSILFGEHRETKK